MTWIGERTPLPLAARLTAILATALLVGVMVGSGGGIASPSPYPVAWPQHHDSVRFDPSNLPPFGSQGNPYVLDVTDPTAVTPAHATSGQKLSISFTFSRGTEVVSHELAEIRVTWVSVGRQSCLISTDPTEDRARKVVDLPQARILMDAATVRGKAYVVGGSDADLNALDTIVEFDPIANTTRTVYTLAMPVRVASVVAHQDSVYILGGSEGTSPVSTVRVYDPIQNTSYAVGDLPEPRYWGAASVAGDMIYFGGGWDDSDRRSDAIFQFNPATGESIQVGALPTPTAILASTSAYGKVYFIGGNTGIGRQTNAIVEYDPVANTSAVVATFPPPSGSDGLEGQTAVTLDGKIYIFNGWDNIARPQVRDEIFVFDPRSGEDAVQVGILPNKVEIGAAAAIHGKAYLFGGAGPWPERRSDITEFTPGGVTARFNLSLQQWEANCNIPRGASRLLDLFVQARYIDHATGQSFIASDEERFAVMVTSHDGRAPPDACPGPPSAPRADGDPVDNHGATTRLSRERALEAAPRPYCIEV